MEEIKVDVAARQDEADLAPGETRPLLRRRRERGGARPFGEVVRVGPVGADRLGDLVVAHKHDPRRPLGDHRERLLVGDTRRNAVGKSVGAVRRHDMAGCEGQRKGRRSGGLNANNLGLEAERVARGNAAANPRTLADRNIEHVEIGMLAHQLERIGRDAERQIAVEGRHGVQVPLLREPHRLLARGLKILAVLDQLRAERPHGRVLLA